ncbi:MULTISPECIES: FAD-dependent oxidoreductase [unclassified Pseudomonas]|uniref:FAD-dependent oxidoreductase n=1 Tax=unclassified Pseudomonas TaxID=196821 RepID=UPI0002A293AB|nr:MULTISPECIES: FAD-dependent oxidoreductase [unclassified Pseudomonas]MBB1609397.1 FAD-binding dehydrogenase [Pseudomonas sp. UMC76]MBB1641936.1 FAD-binding dehydrogenase [Pseudomonas sp. UME83]NTX91778.1 FAD-dependent oxidoreductase [Pseudomonas sp. UMA643]NTY21047.1 FAD-dependent oxidoreductase [Pseudomonas sp. UMC3103]NTY25537.1 FAD-dependent oxidoreductase [Pseudomonas sp. UMA603]
MSPAPNLPLTDCDLLVVGSGAAGLAAAVTAAWHGQKVILVEKEAVFGGATAWSGGWAWVPRNPLARRAGIEEDIEQPRTYLRNELGDYYDAARVDAFLEAAPHMVAFFEQHTRLQFADGNGIPDMHGDTPGAASGGHQVIAAPYDAREVGDLLPRLRRTMRETSFLGMPIMAGADLAAFLSMTRSPRAFVHVAKRVLAHFYHLARYGRAMHLVNGVALVARLAKSAQDLGVRLMESCPAQRLLLEDGAMRGAVVKTPRGELEIRAKAVVLAAGGFPNDPERRRQLFPRDASGHANLALPPTSCSGDGLRLGEAAGGSVETNLRSPVAWAPVSKVAHRDGSVGHFPHIIERGKPGIIGVLANGKRFVNEAHGYYDYVSAMLAALPEDQVPCSWLVCDQRFLRRYGLGYVRPAPLPIGAHLRSGYLKRGASIEQLAQVCGIDPQGLAQTVADFNRHARNGEDPAFGRGSTAFNRKQGDAANSGPNPCVAPIEHGPFYAVKVQPGCFGTFAGLKTDGQARVLGADGQPIPGLYAAGTDMASVFGGHYPSGGINLGPALTFGYVAGRHAAGAHDYEPQAGATPCKHASATATA